MILFCSVLFCDREYHFLPSIRVLFSFILIYLGAGIGIFVYVAKVDIFVVEEPVLWCLWMKVSDRWVIGKEPLSQEPDVGL